MTAIVDFQSEWFSLFSICKSPRYFLQYQVSSLLAFDDEII